MKKIIPSTLIFSSLISGNVLAAQGTTPVCNAGPFNLVIVEKNLGEEEKDASTHQQVCQFMVVGGGLTGDPKKNRKAVPTCFNIDGLIANSNISISFGDIPTNAIIDAYLVRCYKNGKWVEKPNLDFTYDNGRISDTCQQIFGTNRNCTITETTNGGRITYTLTIADG